MKKAFTLAEVLITLGIIGVVAALTIPVLIQKHQKKVVVTRLQGFYSIINQAVKQSENDNGSCENWELPENGNMDSLTDFYNNYFGKYLKTYSVGQFDRNMYNEQGELTNVYKYLKVVFANGSSMLMGGNAAGIDIIFYPETKNIDKKGSRVSFDFCFNKANTAGPKNSVEPYTTGWDGTRETLITHARYGCGKQISNSYCAKLIQYDGWKISDDYPW